MPLGSFKKLANPQAAFAFTLQGADPCRLGLIPAPAFSSTEQAAEMSELYWQPLSRDVPFNEYNTNL